MQYYKYCWFKASTREACLYKKHRALCIPSSGLLSYRNFVLVWEVSEVWIVLSKQFLYKSACNVLRSYLETGFSVTGLSGNIIKTKRLAKQTSSLTGNTKKEKNTDFFLNLLEDF